MVSGSFTFIGTIIKLGEVFSSKRNQNDTPDIEWKKQVKVDSLITKVDFKFGKQIFLLLEIKTCDSIYTNMESQPSQKTEYAHWGKQ